MKIAVIAAGGKTGRLFVDVALAAGHTVNAGVLGKDNFPKHPHLHVFHCDATKSDEIARLLAGQDAVASFIGHTKGSDPNVQTVAIKAVIDCMKKLSIKRIVSLTGSGVRFPKDKITLTDRLLNFGIGQIDPQRVEDGKRHVQVLEQSGLSWTVIRVLKLQNTRLKPYSLLEHGPTKPYVGRIEVAHAVLQVIEANSFIHLAPIIGRPE